MKKDLLYNFANLVLTDNKLKRFMKKKDFNSFMRLKISNGEMDFALANKIAKAIKKWAITMGATHYTHWFFPLTGTYAEKHISFLDYGSKGEFINKFNGNSLIKGETDASSFPSGGERLNFEARGYTVWDYSSPVFIKKDDNENKVLYIPTAFCTYNGVSVDEKTPLLRATEYLNKETTKLLNTLGFSDVKSVVCEVGCEQEYFLVDKELYSKREDLVFTGRTLLGADAIKSQETSHHYLGQIKPKVSAFMHDLNKELWELGIMAKIQHNEVAPCQHEIVSVYAQVNIVADQNSLLMEVMNKVADKHGFKVLFHEKPYKGLNGSGKHNNWSVSTNTGVNLLNINQADETVFMLIFTSIISAIDKHYDLLKMSTSSLGNDLRLGGSEAPPSIISVFIGEDMKEMFDNFVKSNKMKKKNNSLLDIKTTKVAKLYKDNCDRNRTTPFAYTGNKFEFRMCGSSQSIALCNTVLSTIVADEIRLINEKLEKTEDTKEKVVLNAILDNISNHSRIIFNGNSYDDAWKKEAKSRGIIDYNNSVDCYKRLIDKDNIELFEKSGVLSKTELNVRYETYLETYISDSLIEAKTLLDMCRKQVFIKIEKFIKKQVGAIENLEKLSVKNKALVLEIKEIANSYEILRTLVEELQTNIEQLNKKENSLTKAEFCRDTINKKLAKIREVYDNIEPKLPEKLKPFPNYDDLLFLKNI